MPTEAPNQATTGRDLGRELIVEMVKAMATLSANIAVLNQKIEDMVSAMDDHRQLTEELNENMAEASGLLGTAVQVVDELSQVAVDEDKNLEWSDVNVVFKKMREESEGDDSYEDEDEEDEK